MPQTNIKHLGIDFGSSSVSVIGYEDIGKEPIVFYDTDLRDTWFATAMAPDTKKFFQRALTEKTVVDSLKEDIIDGKNTDNVKAFITKLFETVSKCRNESEEYDFSNLETICFGYPTYTPTCTKAYCEKVRDIIKSCLKAFGATDVRIICAPEPELAARGYNEANKNVGEYKKAIKDGDLILVVDLGGYTLDMSILLANKNAGDSISLRPLANSESIESERMQISMGKRITGDICVQIYKGDNNSPKPEFDYNVEQQKCLFFSQSKDNTAPTLLKVKSPLPTDPDIEITKFVLAKEQRGNSVSVEKGKATVTVGIYYSDDDRTISIGRSFTHCSNIIDNYINVSLSANRFSNKRISHVIFTGGTSRIGELCETIKNKLTHNKLVDPSAKLMYVDRPSEETLTIRKANDQSGYEKLSSVNVVALGAAIAAAQEDPTDDPNGFFVSGITVDEDKLKCELLSKRNAALEQEILDFCNKEHLCEDCQAKLAKLLEDMQYPC